MLVFKRCDYLVSDPKYLGDPYSLVFFQQVTYYAKGGTKTINNCLQELKHGKVSGKSRDVWTNEKLLIPPVPPSGLLGCSIIDIKYFATVSEQQSTYSKNLSQ